MTITPGSTVGMNMALQKMNFKATVLKRPLKRQKIDIIKRFPTLMPFFCDHQTSKLSVQREHLAFKCYAYVLNRKSLAKHLKGGFHIGNRRLCTNLAALRKFLKLIWWQLELLLFSPPLFLPPLHSPYEVFSRRTFRSSLETAVGLQNTGLGPLHSQGPGWMVEPTAAGCSKS